MKINHGYQDSRAAQAQDAAKAQETAAAAQARGAKAAAGASKPGGADEVNLSPLAAALQGALSDSPSRAAYLDALAADFAAGDYQPDAQATASGIIAESLDKPPGPADV